MINAIIIEDEKAAFEQLNNILKSSYETQINVIGHETGVEKGIRLINELNPQLVFLDIELEDGNGFEILDYFTNSSSFEVIFTTGLKDYKEKAMDYFAFYYLNKPILKSQLTVVIDKFLSKQTSFDSNKYFAFKDQLKYQSKKISLPMKNGDFIIIDIDDIMYCEADGSYSRFYTKDHKTYITSNNLKKIETLLQHFIF